MLDPEPQTTRRQRNWLALGLFLALACLGYAYVRSFLGIDPFAAVRQKKGLGQNVQMSLEDVGVRMYEGGQLVAKMDLDRADIREDRLFTDLYGVHNGLIFDGSTAYEFEAKRAVWHTARKIMEVKEGGKIRGEDVDLFIPAFTFDQNKRILEAPGTLRGTLMKGKIEADRLRFNLKTREGSIGPAVWTGPATIAFQEDEAARFWTIRAPNGETRFKGDLAYHDGGVTASDGEVIVMAEQVEHNRKTGVLIAKGNVRYFGREANLTCPEAVIYRREQRAVFTGGVTMLVKPEDQRGPAKVEDLPAFKSMKPEELKVAPPAKRTPEEKKLDEELRSSESARRYPIVFRADRLEYWYRKGERRAKIEGSPEAHQVLSGNRWRRLWTHRAEYDGERDRLVLFSSEGRFETRVKSSIGDDLRAARVEVSTKKGDDEMTAKNVQGEIFDDESETQGGSEPPPGTPLAR
jgi:hypothetical protein